VQQFVVDRIEQIAKAPAARLRQSAGGAAHAGEQESDQRGKARIAVVG
jgi:hypothetical protein